MPTRSLVPVLDSCTVHSTTKTTTALVNIAHEGLRAGCSDSGRIIAYPDMTAFSNSVRFGGDSPLKLHRSKSAGKSSGLRAVNRQHRINRLKNDPGAWVSSASVAM